MRHLLVSGANPDRTYNEPRKMYQALRRLGVPDAAITLGLADFVRWIYCVRIASSLSIGSW